MVIFTSSSTPFFSFRLRFAWCVVCNYRISTSFANGNYIYEIGMPQKEHQRKMFSFFSQFLVDQRAKDSNLYSSGCGASLCLLNLIFSFMNDKYVNIWTCILNDEMLVLWVKQARFNQVYSLSCIHLTRTLKDWRGERKMKGKKKQQMGTKIDKQQDQDDGSQLIAYIVVPKQNREK